LLACSKTCQTANNFSSCICGQRICNQTGDSISSQSSGLAKPQGTTSHGNHERLPPILKTSSRYIFTGSSIFAHIFHATLGQEGQTITSTCLNASLKSFLINSLTSAALL